LVNATDHRIRYAVLVLAALVLTAAAGLRGAEHDEQYTLFLTAGMPRPDWPSTVFPAGVVAQAQAGRATLGGIAHDLRNTDVHPPLYFWAVSFWRFVFGPSLLAARMFSVLCGVASIALVGAIARRFAVRPVVAMLLTLGCYGFVYTNAVARGFALAETMTLCGVVLLLGRRRLLAGLCLGAACCSNYLAVFPAAAIILADGAWTAIPAAVPFLALDAWLFSAQHAARDGQFPQFDLWPALVRLTGYQVASVFGGLPRYVDGSWHIAVEVGVALSAIALLVAIIRSRPWRAHRKILAAAAAPPVGLLLLGAVFDNTPIELRYLSFGLPFVALLAAASLKHRLLALTGGVQVAAIVGLLLSPRTMQPARGAAAEAARLAGTAVVLLPAGNDGVGIVGAFGIEAPPTLPVLLIRPADPIADRIAPYQRVALAPLAVDRESTAAVAAARGVLVPPTWRRITIGSNLEVYQRGE
jgi:hypothetical protein